MAGGPAGADITPDMFPVPSTSGMGAMQDLREGMHQALYNDKVGSDMLHFFYPEGMFDSGKACNTGGGKGSFPSPGLEAL